MRNLTTALTIILTALFASACAQDPGTRTTNVGNWQVECSAEVCLVTLYKTGAGDNSVVVKIDKPTMKPDNFGFLVSGRVDKSKGFVAMFAKTTVDSSRRGCAGSANGRRPADCYHVEVVKDTTFNGPFEDCEHGLCFARAPGQYVGAKGSPKRINLLRQFKNDDFIIVIHQNKNGKLRRVSLDISGFKTAYDTALSMLRSDNPK